MFDDPNWRIATADRIRDEINDYASKNADNRYSTRLSPSWLGEECAAASYYRWHWAYELKPQDGRMRRYNDLGEVHEARATEWLRNTGWIIREKDETGNQLAVTDFNGHLYGKVDGIGKHPIHTNNIEVLLEYKFVNTKRFLALIKEPLKIADPKYYGQIVLYMMYLNLPLCVWFPTNRNDDDIKPIIIPRDDAYARDLLNKAQEIATTTVRPARIAETPSFYKCKMCDAKDVCHGLRPPVVSCRSCVKCSPTDGGKFFCNQWQQVIPSKDAIKAACGNYSPIK